MTCNEKSPKYVKNPELYVCNTKTNQWVLKTSALGKKIIKDGKKQTQAPKKPSKPVPKKKPAASLPPKKTQIPIQPKFADFSPSSIPILFRNFLKKKIASLREPRNKFFDSLKFSVEKATSLSSNWKIVTLTLNEFPYKFKHLSDYPYNHLGDKIRSKFNRLVYTDINGLGINAEWFDEQVKYVKSLSHSDQKLIYDYSVGPATINTDAKRARLNEIIINSPPLKNKLTVWRGVKSDYVSLDTHKFYQNAQKFVSTSLDPKIAIESFMGLMKCCLLKITLLPGTRALFMGLSKYEVEHEILLPTDSLFYVLQKNIHVLNGPRPLTMFNMVYVKEIRKGLKLSFKDMKVKQKPTPIVKKPVHSVPNKPIPCNPKNKAYALNPNLFVCNKKTGRWVLKTSSIGKNILKTKPPTPKPTGNSFYENIKKIFEKPIKKVIAAAAPPKKQIVCNEKSTKYLKNPDLYVCNPKSKMWVLKTSALGKKILKDT